MQKILDPNPHVAPQQHEIRAFKKEKKRKEDHILNLQDVLQDTGTGGANDILDMIVGNSPTSLKSPSKTKAIRDKENKDIKDIKEKKSKEKEQLNGSKEKKKQEKKKSKVDEVK